MDITNILSLLGGLALFLYADDEWRIGSCSRQYGSLWVTIC